LADPALQQVIAELKGVATTAESVSTRTKAAGASVREMGAGVAAAASQYKGIASQLQDAAARADAAKRAFSEAAQAIGGDQRLANSMFPQLARDAQQAETELRNLQASARETVGVLDEVGTAAQTGGSGFLQMAGSIGNVVTGIWAGSQMVLGFASNAGHAAMSILSLNANLEQTQTAFRQLLGSQTAADQFVKQLQDFAAHTPFEFPQLSKAAQQLIGVGVAAKDVLPYMTAIGDSVSAFGGGAEQIDQVTRAITQMQSKGRIMAEEMMQLTEAQIPGWQALAKATGLTVAQLQDLSSQGKLATDTYLPKLISGLETLYAGNMQAQSTTFSGLKSTLDDIARMTIADITKPMFDRAEAGLQSLVDTVQSPGFQEGMQRWGTIIDDTFVKIGHLGQAVADLPATKVIELVVKTTAEDPGRVGSVAGNLIENAPVIGPAVNLVQSGIAADQQIRKYNDDQREAAKLTNEWATAYQRYIDLHSRDEAFIGNQDALNREAEDYAHQQEQIARTLADSVRQGSAWQWVVANNVLVAKQNAQALLALNTSMSDHTRMTIAEAREQSSLVTQYTDAGRAALAAGYATGQAYVSYVDMYNAAKSLRETQQGLAQAYQNGLGAMNAAQASGAQYKSELDALTAAHDALIEKKKEGQPLDEREQMLLDKYPQLYGRLQGGIRDATIGAGLYAAANTEVMLAQDDLNDAINRGEKNLGPYQQRLRDAQKLAGDSEFADPMTTSLNSLAGTVDTVLVPALNSLRDVIQQLDGRSFTITGKVVVDDSALGAFFSGVGGGGIGVGLTAAGPGDTYTAPGAGQHNATGGTPPPPANAGGSARGMANSLLSGVDTAAFPRLGPAANASGPLGPAPGPDFTQPTQQAHDATAEITRQMGDASQQFSEDYLNHLKTYTDAAKGALDLYEQAAKLASDSTIQSVQLTDSLRASVGNLQAIADFATSSTGDSAAKFDGDYLDHLKAYTDAAKGAVDLLSTTLQFTKDMGDTVVEFGDWQRKNVGNLKFIAEEATRSTGDSAQLFGGGYLTQLKFYTDAAKGAVELESSTLQFVKDMGDTVVQFGDWQKRNVANLKFIAEFSARSVGDSAAMFDGPYLTHLKDYADAAKGAIEVESGALQLVKDMGDTVVLFGDWQRSNLANLKFIAEFSTRSVGDSAAMFSGPYLTNIKAYTDAAGAALQLLSSTLDLLDAIRSKSGAMVLAQTDMTGSFRALATQAHDATQAVGDSSDTWSEKLYPNLKDFTDRAGASLQLVSSTLDLVTAISQQGKSLALAQTDLTGTFTALTHQAHTAATAVGDSSKTWDSSLYPNLKDFNDAASSSLSLLGNVVTLLGSIHDASKGTLDLAGDETALFTMLAGVSRQAADQVDSAAHGWDADVNQGITDFSDAAGKSVTLLGNVIELLKAVHDPDFDPAVFGQDLATLFTNLRLVASTAADQVKVAGDTWDSDVNQGITDFTDAAGKSLGLLSSTVTTLKDIASLPDSFPDVSTLAGRLVADAVTINQAVGDAEKQWEALVAKDDAIPMDAISKWADGAGKAVSLVGDVAGAYKAMADESSLTQRSVQVFEHNWEVILAMLPDLVEKSKPYLEDAKQFKSIAEMIAKEFNDAKSAIESVSGPSSSSSGGNGGGGGGGAAAAMLSKYEAGPGWGAPPTGLAMTAKHRLSFNEFLAQTLGWSTDTQRVLNNKTIEVHHTIDTSALNQAIQYQASLLKPKYDAQGRPNQPLDRTYADEFLSLLQIMQANSDVFNKGQQSLIVEGLKRQLGQLGLTNDAALGRALFGSMGLTPETLKHMGLDKKTIDDLTSSMGQSFLNGTANPVADATGTAVSDALTAGMQPFADTVGSSVHDAAYTAIHDVAHIQARVIADTVGPVIDRAFDRGVRNLATQLASAAT